MWMHFIRDALFTAHREWQTSVLREKRKGVPAVLVETGQGGCPLCGARALACICSLEGAKCAFQNPNYVDTNNPTACWIADCL